jgi:hypothetical protein
MDPTAALKQLDSAMACKDRESIAEFAEALLTWLAKGGFEPEVSLIDDWRAEFDRAQWYGYLRDLVRAARA